MSHVPSHHSGIEDSHNTFLVIFKVHGDSINLWPKAKIQSAGDTHTFRIACHNVETHPEDVGSDIQVFMLSDPAPLIDKCEFQDQQPNGQPISHSEVATFMTGPVSSSRKTSYAIDVSISDKTISPADIVEDDCEKIGVAYVYLDPDFSSQGVQRTPIIAAHNHRPIGQIQIEYSIITNPVGYGQPAPKPEWLFKGPQMHAGHRGAGSGRRMDLPEELLENTVASFNYAHRHGADMCELDVLVSADGLPVVYHDFDVDAVTAHQSSDELGKFTVQANEFTVKQMREFRLLALHDGEGCPYTLNVPNQAESNRPFPTLAEVLNEVDETCGMNIEIKWPQMLENGKMEARKYREVNDFVDRIISVVDAHARDRRIILESFHADLVIMLRMKQNRFPVVFLSQGMTDQYTRYVDIRARSIRNGIYFAQAFDLAGIDLISEYYLLSGRKLVDFIEDHGLVARGWGNISEHPESLSILEDIGLQCITYDKIDLLRREASRMQSQLETDQFIEQESYKQQEKQQQQEKQEHQQLSQTTAVIYRQDDGGDTEPRSDFLEKQPSAIVA